MGSNGDNREKQDWEFNPKTPNAEAEGGLPPTDLVISRIPERSQGFHDLWPHMPKLNTGNRRVKERREQTWLGAAG